MERRTAFRPGFALVVVAGLAVVAAGALGATGGTTTRATETEAGAQVAPPTDGTAVIATDSNSRLGRGSDGP
jgi:hypothetical protein